MIEIEKKFLLTPEQQYALLDGATMQGARSVEDAYLDTADFRLTTNDLWLRVRDGAYELKAPLRTGNGSQAATNRYRELTVIDDIGRELGIDAADDFATALARAGIKSFMTCSTKRESYEKQGFHIDIDAVTYGDSAFEYAIAEIELMVNDESQADAAEARIVAFAQQFGLTVDQVILGKVLAYLKAEKADHYQAVVESWS